MSSTHNQEHIRLREQVDGILAILNNVPPPGTPPAPTPAPTPTPAPAGDTFSFTSGSMPANCTLTRSTVGWHNTSTPFQLAQKAIDVARFQHVDWSGALLGLLFEPTQENLLHYGRSPGGTGWTSIGAGLTRTTGRTDPLGGTDAVRLQAAAGGNAIFQGITSVAGEQLASVYVKSASGATQKITVRDPQTNAWVEQTIYATEFRRVAYVGTGTSFFNFTIGAAAGEALDVDVWGADFYEEGAHYYISPFPSNAAATATRGQDVLTFTGLTNGSRDIEIDWRDANSDDGTYYIYAETISGGTYTLEADNVNQLGRHLREVRFIAAGTTPPPAPTPTPTPTPSASALGNVAIIGDSLMRGWLANPGYPIYAPGDRLRTLLRSAGYTLTYVGTELTAMSPGGWHVTATGGWTISDIDAQTSAVAALNPDMVIISIGTNDLASSSPTIDTEITAYLDALETAVGTIPIYVCAPVELSWFHAASYTLLRDAMEDWCAAGGANRIFLDLAAIGMDVEGSGADGNGDGTHWSETGANKVAAAMFAKIASVPAPPSAPPAAGTIFRTQMESLNEALPIFYMDAGRAGFADGSSKYCGGFVYKMGEPSTTGTLVLRPWFIIMPVDDGSGGYAYSEAPNSLLEISFFRTYRRTPPGGWTKVYEMYENPNSGVWFDWYDAASGGFSGTDIPNSAKGSGLEAYVFGGKIYVPMSAFITGDHVMFHGGTGETFNYNVDSGDWISQQIQVRIVQVDSGGADDRANIPLCMNIGCDRTNGRLDEYMHSSYLTIPGDGSPKLITNINMDVYKACASCGGNVGGVNKTCYDYTLGVMQGSDVDGNPPPIPVFGS